MFPKYPRRVANAPPPRWRRWPPRRAPVFVRRTVPEIQSVALCRHPSHFPGRCHTPPRDQSAPCPFRSEPSFVSNAMLLALPPVVARARGPVAACVTRCLARASPNSGIGRSSAPLVAVAAHTPRGAQSPSRTFASTSACRSRSSLRSVFHVRKHGTQRSVRLYSVVNSDTESDATATSAIKSVETRLGVTLSSEPTTPTAPPVVVVMSGPSGVGKDAVLRRLLEQRPELTMLVTATDRAMRKGEVNGVDYHFVSTKDFEAMIQDDELIEHAVVYEQYKGIPKSSVRNKLSSNEDVILRLDVQGAATVKKIIPNSISIFITAESEFSLAKRLAKRGTETEDELTKRIETAREEIEQISEFDYVVVNGEGKLEQAANKLGSIIDAEKCRRGRGEVNL